MTIPTRRLHTQLGIATVFQDLALCENLNVVENLFLGRELGRAGSTKSRWRSGPGSCCGSCRRRSRPSGSPVASLSGGQRQTVAIARSLLGDPKIIILDEPTAALGVAQTAEVLNLVERLRENGHGVIMISHNMDDVRAVADRVVVLRLGRNNGVFDARMYITEEIVAADHRCRGQRRHPTRRPRLQASRDRPPKGASVSDVDTQSTADRGYDLQDERLTGRRAARRGRRPGRPGPRRRPRRAAGHRRAAGDLDGVPGLNPFFLSSANLVNLLLESVPVGVIALGIVCVLLVGQIDLSVGSVSGLSAAIDGHALRQAGLAGLAGGR